MALHDELLTLAKELVDRNPGSAIAGDLRRGVSSAYYAVFHLLVHEAKNIATEFVMLQAARHQADYDFLAVITQAQAQTDVTRAELVFLDWAVVQADPASDSFLTELLCRGMPRDKERLDASKNYQLGLVIVADGGGQASGDVAAGLAIRTVGGSLVPLVARSLTCGERHPQKAGGGHRLRPEGSE